MRKRRPIVFAAVITFIANWVVLAQENSRTDVPLKNWPAPLHWQAPAGESQTAASRDFVHRVTASTNASLPISTVVLDFVALAPCRLVDTRTAAGFTGAFGPPSLAGGASRTFPIPTSTTCSIPAVAQGYSLNVTVVPPAPLGFLTIFPTGQTRPTASTLNSTQGQVVANAAIVPAGTSGSVDVFSSNNTDLVIDINGYYAASSNVGGLSSTFLGLNALASITSGTGNSAFGQSALFHSSTGNSNTAMGESALYDTTTGSDNIAIGADAGSMITAGNNNIDIGNVGVSGDNQTMRIGTYGSQVAVYLAGARGNVTGVANAVPLLIDSNGQLGTASSSARFKEDIQDMSDASDGLLRLRPVTFRYRQPYANGDQPIDYGLIAEEVAEIYPDLAVTGADGQIETVQYQKLTPMLLNEVQKQYKRAQHQDETIRRLELRLAALEAQLAAAAERQP